MDDHGEATPIEADVLYKLRAQRDLWFERYGLTLNDEVQCVHCKGLTPVTFNHPARMDYYRHWLDVVYEYDVEPEDGQEYHTILRAHLDDRMEEDYRTYCREYEESYDGGG